MRLLGPFEEAWIMRLLVAALLWQTIYGSSNPPPRVLRTPGSVSVRQQIAWAKAYKRLMSDSSAAKGPTKKFRRVVGPKVAVKDEELVTVDYQDMKPPAVFVDGYNVIGFANVWEQRVGVSLDEARDRLISDMGVLRGGTGWHIELVFDAYKHSSPERTESIDGVVVTFTSPSETADDCIERRFNTLAQAGFANMVVATDDNLLRMTAQQLGAGFLTCSMLLEEIRIAYSGWEAEEGAMAKTAKEARPTIGDGLTPELKDAISLLRKKQQLQQAIADEERKRTQFTSPDGRDNHQLRTKATYVDVTPQLLSQLKAQLVVESPHPPEEEKKRQQKAESDNLGLSDSDIDKLLRMSKQKARPKKKKNNNNKSDQ